MKEVFSFNNCIKTKYSRSELLFFSAYTIWVTYALLRYTYIGKLLSFTRYREEIKLVVLILLAIKFWNDEKYQIRNFIGLAVVFYVGAVEYYVQDKTVSLFILFAFIFSTRNVIFKDILKISFLIEAAVLSITVILSVKGIIPNNIWDMGVRQRYDLGFTYCTFSSHLLLFITMVYCCIRKRIRFVEMLILFLLNVSLFLYTDTRLDLCIVLIYLLAFYGWTLFSKTIHNNFFSVVLFQYSGVLIAFVSVIAQYFYDPNIKWYRVFNELLSDRLNLGHNAIVEYGIRLFGQQIRWVGQGSLKNNPMLTYNYVDCSFLKYLLNYGIVFELCLLIALVYIGKKAIERNEHALCISLLFLYIFAMVDAELCVLAFHPFLLKIGELINPPVGDQL